MSREEFRRFVQEKQEEERKDLQLIAENVEREKRKQEKEAWR